MLLTTGCSLDEENKSAMTTDKEWSTEAGYEKLINGCYYYLVRTVYGQAEDTYVIGAEGGTDIWQDANPDGTNGNWSKALRYTDFGSSVYMFNEAYQGFYATLNQCNAAIQYGGKVEGLDKAKIAEAYFLRAFTLFNIVENYGGKYMPLEPTTSPITSLTCSSINDFYETIFSDCQYAMENLPKSQSVTGHAIKAAAYHLYAKACLTYATYTDGLCGATAISTEESKTLLNDALTQAEKLINEASSTFGVELYSEIEDVFDENNNKANKEALFVVTHSTITALNPRGNYFNRVWKHFAAYNNNTAGVYLGGLTPSYETEVAGLATKRLAKGNCYMEPSKKFLDLFQEKDGRYAAFFQDVYYVNKVNNTTKDGYTWTKDDATRYGLSTNRVGNTAYDIKVGDTAVYLPRKTYTQAEKDACRYAIYNLEDNYKDATKPLKYFPSLKKADCPKYYPEGGNANKPYTGADCIVYRLGETYLVAAEAAWRLGKTDLALKYINALRNRACIGHDNSLKLSSVDQNVLLDEYALEMCGEWNRWTTLKRFRAFRDRIITQKFNPQITEFKDDYYLRPIAASEISLIENGDEYQNPGF